MIHCISMSLYDYSTNRALLLLQETPVANRTLFSKEKELQAVYGLSFKEFCYTLEYLHLWKMNLIR